MVSLKDYKNNLPPLKNICNEAKGYAETYYRMIKKVQITNNLFWTMSIFKQSTYENVIFYNVNC